MQTNKLLKLTIALFAALTFVLNTNAQSSTASLTGTVTDSNGAVIAGAAVTITNAGTGFKRQASTDQAGKFTFSQLPAATYVLRVESTGFSPAEVPALTLNVNDQRAVSIELAVGNVSGSVQVINQPDLIDDSSVVGTTVNREFVRNLPLNGRSFQSLFELTPGVVLTPSGDGGQGQFSVNGQRTNSNYVTVDGVGANVSAAVGNSLGQNGNGSVPGFAATGGTNNLVSVDALQEFTIQTSTYAPEFGRTPGAQVSIVTRSGTNRFTGALFEYFRNEKLDANDWFANRNRLNRAPLRQNNFGGVVGGRIVKDKTFFFASYEGLRLQQPQQGTFFVPSDALRSGAAASLRPFIEAFPRVNGPLDTFNNQPTGYGVFNAVYSDKVKLDAMSVRVDQNFNNRISAFGRYNYSPSYSVNRLTNPTTPGTTKADTVTLTVGSAQIINSRIVNDLRFNYSKYKSSLNLELDTLGGGVPFDLSSVPGVSGASRPVFGVFLVDLNPSTFGLRFSPGIFIGELSSSKTQQINIVDSLTFQAGPHALKFGFDYRRLNPTFRQYDYFSTFSIFTAASLTTGILGGPNPIIAGQINQLQVRADSGERNPITNNLSIYAQDTWKVTRRITLSYGLRYELNPPPREKDGRNPAIAVNIDTPANIALAPSGADLYETGYGNFAPRVGVAWQANDKNGWQTMVRAGFGVFYDLGGGSAAGSVFSNVFPYVSSKTISNFAGIPYPLTAAQVAPNPIATTLPASTEVYAWESGLKLPRTYQFSFAVEQELGNNQTVSVTFLGARGRALLRQDFIQNPNANFPGGVVVTRNSAFSNYDSMQLQFTRRLSRGLQALAAYTLATSTDTASNDVQRTASLLLVPAGNDRGPSDFDIRHSFTGAITYNIPSPVKSGIGKAILGGWATDAIFRYRSAPPVNVVVNNLNFSQNGSASTTRPNIVLNQPFYLAGAQYPGGRAINPAAFVSPGGGNRGNLTRNALRGFSARQIDVTLRRDFKIKENMGIQLRGEVFNLFNTPNFGNPENRFGNPSFGLATQMLGRSLSNTASGGTGLNSAFQIGGPRSIQLSARFYF